jgi:hypothetical protein
MVGIASVGLLKTSIILRSTLVKAAASLGISSSALSAAYLRAAVGPDGDPWEPFAIGIMCSARSCSVGAKQIPYSTKSEIKSQMIMPPGGSEGTFLSARCFYTSAKVKVAPGVLQSLESACENSQRR